MPRHIYVVMKTSSIMMRAIHTHQAKTNAKIFLVLRDIDRRLQILQMTTLMLTNYSFHTLQDPV